LVPARPVGQRVVRLRRALDYAQGLQQDEERAGERQLTGFLPHQVPVDLFAERPYQGQRAREVGVMLGEGAQPGQDEIGGAEHGQPERGDVEFFRTGEQVPADRDSAEAVDDVDHLVCVEGLDQPSLWRPLDGHAASRQRLGGAAGVLLEDDEVHVVHRRGRSVRVGGTPASQGERQPCRLQHPGCFLHGLQQRRGSGRPEAGRGRHQPRSLDCVMAAA
jgi:hypothetical protein